MNLQSVKKSDDKTKKLINTRQPNLSTYQVNEIITLNGKLI